MIRRQFIKKGAATLALAGLGVTGIPLTVKIGRTETLRRTSLPIPPLLDTTLNGGQAGLTVQQGTRSFFPGLSTPTLGYNGSFLGPTIRVQDGQRVQLHVDNQLKETTTVHWHGLHVPAKWDGGPRQVIEAGGSWHPDFTIKQQAATLWYHPHALGRTGEHVYGGLAGLFIIDDEVSAGLTIPKDYGIDDIPLVIQDRRFYEDGRFAFVTSGHDIMHGVVGNYLLVNGIMEPQLRVVHGVTRFRLLNGSNSSIYKLSVSDRRPFWVIASDGGFLARSEQVDSLIFTAGERYEILLDCSADRPGSRISMMIEQYGGNQFRALDLEVGAERGAVETVAEELYPPARLNPLDSIKTRTFSMETMSSGGRLTINSNHMDINRIDATVKRGTLEVWEIANNAGMMMRLPHSMHLHDVQFQVLDRNGKPPGPLERGRKDTVLLMPGERVRIISRFEDYTGIYMYHCHMLEHEDNGMMGQFEVIG